MKRLIQLFLILFTFYPLYDIRGQVNNLGVKKIVIDPGHGGKDPGTLGTGRYKQAEKDVALEVSILLGDYIKSSFPEIEIIYTRKSDKFIKLSERTRIANQANANLFISIHCDAFPDKTVYGSSTYVMGMHKNATNLNVAIRENSSILMENNYKSNYEGFDPEEPESYIALSMYQSNYIANSLLLASKIQHQFKNRVNRKDRGVKQAGFLVLSRAAMPSVLIELGFLTNIKEEDFLNTDDGKVFMASAIFRAVKEYKLELDGIIKENPIDLNRENNLFFSLQFLSSESKINLDQLVIEDKKLIKEFKENHFYKYSLGHAKELRDLDVLKYKLDEYGYKDYFTIAFLNGQKISLSEALSILK
ncbi:N-acetylmuramoyl-L-alanine amidase [Flavobacteriales bacterium]|nr:N-acetylmuramoyl-L-alanine amidase [Flavobacteriales bacterium]